MAEDREILRTLWDGQLPVCFRVAPEEVITMQQPEPFYVMVSRMSYFALTADKVTKHFVRFVSDAKQNGQEMWLESDGNLVQWHYPIGLQWDLCVSELTLPWNITVHFQNFPDKELVRCNTKSLLEAHFMSTIKEADALKHRSQIMSSMQKRDHNQLWTGLQNNKFEQFWSINKKLMEHTNDELFRNIPFRIYQIGQKFIQTLIRPMNESGRLVTLGDLISDVIQDSFDSGNECKFRVIIHGVEPPLETPIMWLSEHMSYPDNFLHISIVGKSKV